MNLHPIKNKKGMSVLILTVFLVSILATISVNIPTASATFSHHSVDIGYYGNSAWYWDAKSWTRPYCYLNDGGGMSADYYNLWYFDTAHIHASIQQVPGSDNNYLEIGYYTLQVALMRQVTVYDSNGLVAQSASNNMQTHSQGIWQWDSIWINQMSEWDSLMTFDDNLRITGSQNDGLTYAFPELPATDYHYANHRWEVAYWMHIQVRDMWGFCVFDSYVNHGYDSSCPIDHQPQYVHDEINNPYNWELDPVCCNKCYASTYVWSEAYGASTVYNVQGALDQEPNNDNCYLAAYQVGSTARVVYHLSNTICSGPIWIYGQIENSECRLLVYVSNDNSNWELAREQMCTQTSYGWIDCGGTTSTYQYVMIIAYDSLTVSAIHVDAIRTGSLT